MTAWLAFGAALVWAVRLLKVRGLWNLPSRNGEDYFVAQRVPAGFYQAEGADLLRRYHRSLFLPLAADAPLALGLAVTGRYAWLVCEQWVALILSVVVYNVMLAHFSARAAVLVGAKGDRPATTVQLSMAPRRLRDHSRVGVELIVAAGVLGSLLLLARASALAPAAADPSHAAHAARRGALLTAWILYLQLGLLLLKVVFVRWRMPLPLKRADDFLRWRGAWLAYHLKLFDTLRVLCALVLLSAMALITLKDVLPRGARAGAIAVWALAVVATVLLLVREGRRLAAVEREIKPVELVEEFPRPPVAEGRFLAGGLLFFSRDNPSVLVRSPEGLALNLGHTSTYLWAGYFVGLALLMAWLVR